jgi:hypothetical protein
MAASKRSFTLTGAGMEAANQARQDLANMLEGLQFPLAGGSQ